MTTLFVALACLVSPAFDNEIPKGAREAFEKTAEFDLYSLDPSQGRKKDGDGNFHGWKVLGKTTLKGADAKTVRDAVEKGRRESNGLVAGCFNPRHGIRFTVDQKTYDIVLCYECLSADVYGGDHELGRFLTTAGPADALNKALRAAKVPLPTQ
jgi:hypothetical protein